MVELEVMVDVEAGVDTRRVITGIGDSGTTTGTATLFTTLIDLGRLVFLISSSLINETKSRSCE